MQVDVEVLLNEALDALNVARNGTVLRCRIIAEVEHDLVDVTPSPTFRRIVAFDDRMAGLVEVPGCMPVRRLVAATNVTANAAKPQMHPARAQLQAVLAAACARRDFADRAVMRAAAGHSATAARIGAADAAAR